MRKSLYWGLSNKVFAALTLIGMIHVSSAFASDMLCLQDPHSGTYGCPVGNSPAVSVCCGSLSRGSHTSDPICIPSILHGFTSQDLSIACFSDWSRETVCTTDSECSSGKCYRSKVSFILITEGGADANVETVRETGKCV